MLKNFFKLFLILFFFNYFSVEAEEVINLNGESLRARSEISITPQSATFTEGATFEVPVLLNTKGKSINTIDLYISYDPNKLSIVKPSTGKSIISLWIQPPSYDNTKGLAHIVGSIPGGIVSNSSLVLSITFQAKAIGTTEVKVLDSSTVLANDGVGTPTVLSFNRATYTILPKPQGAVVVYSDTHPFSALWYNNNNPVLAWNRDVGVIGYSYLLDEKPNTIVDNKNLTNDNSIAYSDLQDGLWYFHIKSLKEPNSWSVPTHFPIRIDTKGPAMFKPKIVYVNDSENNRALVTFFTTDNLSGIDHYEVGIIDKSQKDTTAPIFVQVESPYEIPQTSLDGSILVVRAYDIAGNSTDSQIKIKLPGRLINWVMNNAVLLLLIILLLFILLYLIHYFLGHKILRKLVLILGLLSSRKHRTKKDVLKDVTEIQKND